jgi:transcription initiation factor TFIIB
LETTLPWKNNDQRSLRTPICAHASNILDYQTGEVICEKCGLVLDQKVLNEADERIYFNVEDANKKERTGPPIKPFQRDQFYTNLYGSRDCAGKMLSIDNLNKMQRLNKMNNSAFNDGSVARNLKIASKAMRMLTDKLSLSEGIFEDAFTIYRRALDRDLIRGKTIEGFIAASLLVVIRERELPRSLIEVSSTIDVDSCVVARLYRELVREFDLRMPVDEPIKYFDKISAKLVLQPRIRVRVLEILSDAKSKGMIQGKKPISIAAAALYLAIKENYSGLTQKQIASVSEISEITLRTRVQELKPLSSLVVTKDPN